MDKFWINYSEGKILESLSDEKFNELKNDSEALNYIVDKDLLYEYAQMLGGIEEVLCSQATLELLASRFCVNKDCIIYQLCSILKDKTYVDKSVLFRGISNVREY